VLWYRDSDGAWHYWTQTSQFAPSSDWTRASWTTPAVPAAAVGVSYALDIEGVGSLTTDDYSLVDMAGSPPVVSVVSPAAGGVLRGVTSLQASASSSVGISRVDYLVNGAVVASSTASPFSASWDSTTFGDGVVTVTARATDTSGVSSTSDPVTATVSNAASRGGNLLTNGSLESFSGSVPDCWQQQGSGTSSFVWARSSVAHSGSYAQSLTISSYTSGSRALVVSQRTVGCAPRVSPGSTYTLGGWYQSDHPIRLVVYYQRTDGVWAYWTQSPFFPASNGVWAQASWTPPAMPADATAVSFGLSLPSAGTLLTDDYTMIAA
jgi:hypothetical protein